MNVQVSINNKMITTGEYPFTITDQYDYSQEGLLIVKKSTVGSPLSTEEDRNQKTEDRKETVKSEEEAVTTETTNHEQRATSNGLFPPEEGPPVPPPSMYHGISTLITRYLYTGREYNIETGMYYYRARVMNPGHGRFLSKDTWTYQPDDFKFIESYSDIVSKLFWGNIIMIQPLIQFVPNNYYMYTHNQPIIYDDPYGNIFGSKSKKCGEMANEAADKYLAGKNILGDLAVAGVGGMIGGHLAGKISTAIGTIVTGHVAGHVAAHGVSHATGLGKLVGAGTAKIGAWVGCMTV